jgi:4a-hydroxytetrahydrobiopterin dehydratase
VPRRCPESAAGLKTHSHGGITDKDFALARKIEEIVLWRPTNRSKDRRRPDKFVKVKK